MTEAAHDPDAATGRASPTPAGDEGPVRYERDRLEFGRALNYFDATFAIATTLLVTTLATGSGEWASWTAFRTAITGPLFAYALSFVVVSTYWWANHRLVSSLDALTPREIKATLLMLAFVVLIPFSTEGLGAYSGVNGEVPTVVYALNVVAVSLCTYLLFRIAIADRLHATPLTRDEILERSVRMLDVPLVFLISVPIALLWSDSAARWSWLSLIALGIVEGRWTKRRQARRAPTAI